MSFPSARMPAATLREVSNLPVDIKARLNAAVETRLSGRTSGTLLPSSRTSSPIADSKNRHDPTYCTDMIGDITEMFLQRERSLPRNNNYLASQTEINEKMRLILVDWLVDVALKFKLHAETFFLAVDLMDRYLAASKTTRSHLQLVGITCVLIAAKYEEIWPPEVKDCINISANTYTRDDILKMERAICGALQFKLTVPTPFPFLARLLDCADADELTRNTAFFFLENSALDYRSLQFLPSQLANASLLLANVMLKKEPWPVALQHSSKARVGDFKECAAKLLEFAHTVPASKYQAIRRKYNVPKFSDVTKLAMPSPQEVAEL
jgi:cyclin A